MLRAESGIDPSVYVTMFSLSRNHDTNGFLSVASCRERRVKLTVFFRQNPDWVYNYISCFCDTI